MRIRMPSSIFYFLLQEQGQGSSFSCEVIHSDLGNISYLDVFRFYPTEISSHGKVCVTIKKSILTFEQLLLQLMIFMCDVF